MLLFQELALADPDAALAAARPPSASARATIFLLRSQGRCRKAGSPRTFRAAA
jgi:hypothetical protein